MGDRVEIECSSRTPNTQVTWLLDKRSLGASSLLKSESFARDDIFHRYNCLIVDLVNSRQNLVSIKFRERLFSTSNTTDEYEAVVEPVDASVENLDDFTDGVGDSIDDFSAENEPEDANLLSDKFVQVDMIGLNEKTDLIRMNGSFGLRCSLLLPGGK